MTEMYMGQIIFAAFQFAPPNYANCLGQIVSISQNSALFSLLGTTYGGDGSTTFQLPHAGGRALLGQGQSPGVGHNYQMGEIAGSESATLNSSQMPMHVHGVTGAVQLQAIANAGADNSLSEPGNNTQFGTIYDTGGSGGTPAIYVPAGTSGTPVNLGGASFAGNTTVAGGNQPFSMMQPYLVVNALIVTQGIYPSRQ